MSVRAQAPTTAKAVSRAPRPRRGTDAGGDQGVTSRLRARSAGAARETEKRVRAGADAGSAIGGAALSGDGAEAERGDDVVSRFRHTRRPGQLRCAHLRLPTGRDIVCVDEHGAQNGMRRGDAVTGAVRVPKEGEQQPAA